MITQNVTIKIGLSAKRMKRCHREFLWFKENSINFIYSIEIVRNGQSITIAMGTSPSSVFELKNSRETSTIYFYECSTFGIWILKWRKSSGKTEKWFSIEICKFCADFRRANDPMEKKKIVNRRVSFKEIEKWFMYSLKFI